MLNWTSVISEDGEEIIPAMTQVIPTPMHTAPQSYWPEDLITGEELYLFFYDNIRAYSIDKGEWVGSIPIEGTISPIQYLWNPGVSALDFGINDTMFSFYFSNGHLEPYQWESPIPSKRYPCGPLEYSSDNFIFGSGIIDLSFLSEEEEVVDVCDSAKYYPNTLLVTNQRVIFFDSEGVIIDSSPISGTPIMFLNGIASPPGYDQYAGILTTTNFINLGIMSSTSIDVIGTLSIPLFDDLKNDVDSFYGDTILPQSALDVFGVYEGAIEVSSVSMYDKREYRILYNDRLVVETYYLDSRPSELITYYLPETGAHRVIYVNLNIGGGQQLKL